MLEIELISNTGQTQKFAFDHAVAILNLRTKSWTLNDPEYEFANGKIRRKSSTIVDKGAPESADEQQEGKRSKKKRIKSGN